MNQLVIVVPCYNEAKVLRETATKLLNLIAGLGEEKVIGCKSLVVFVDDGSTDSSWKIISDLNKSNTNFKGIKLASNKGHQNALLAGILNSYSYADILITLDADLQDDIHIIKEMISKYNQGNDIVYGVPYDRGTETLFKRWTAQIFHKTMRLLGVNVIYNHSDFRLISKRVIDSLRDFKEVNLFLRGIFPSIGFSNDVVKYSISARTTGQSKYTLKKMLSLGINGITSFSNIPLRLVTFLGAISLLISCALTGYLLYCKSFLVDSCSININTALIFFLGSIQLLGLGLIGEYLGRIYQEVKGRPRYIIEESHLKA